MNRISWLPRHLRALAIAVLSVVMVLPLVWLVSTSVREPGQPLPTELEWIPDPVVLDNYAEVFREVDFEIFFANSVLISISAVLVNTLFASMTGFAIARSSSRLRRMLIGLCFAASMVPLTAIWLPRFMLIEKLGLIDSRWSLLVPTLMGTSPFFVLLFAWSFMRLPADYYEAAQLDGAGPIRSWLGIGMPVIRPTTVAVGVLTLFHYWKDFIEPLLYIHSIDKMTLPLGLKALQQLDRTNWPILMAASVMFVVPVVLLFLAAERWILQEHRGQGWLGR